ncbi:G patch domain and ankyrin repeat-containing protein 1-like [Dysidea avara]|uniref:G patch domain and ankyrin repeat-containing protein 1-like n=1 Tax=Dysidea avara TaxID=196820 RepID=UPI00331F7281
MATSTNDESEVSSTGWLFSKRALYQNRAFALQKPIAFLPERVRVATPTKPAARVDTPSGEEVKKMYEDIVSQPSTRSLENTERTRSGSTPLGKAKKALTKLRRRSGSLTRRLSFSSSKKDTKSTTVSATKLFQAAQSGDLVTIEEALLQDKFDINMTDSYNWTLLMCAAYAGHHPVVELLVRHRALWEEVRDRRGFNAADLATTGGHVSIVDLLVTPSHQPSDSPAANVNIRSRRKRRRSTIEKNLPEKFFCSVCQIEVNGLLEHEHNLSTVHQFNSQFRSTDIPYSIPHSNKGFQLLMKGGWNPECGLGPDGQGTRQPVKTVLKRDREGLGSGKKLKPRVTHFPSFDKSAIHRSPIRTRGAARRQEEEDLTRSSKRARQDALRKDKLWEMNMRRYLNAEDDLTEHLHCQ